MSFFFLLCICSFTPTNAPLTHGYDRRAFSIALPFRRSSPTLDALNHPRADACHRTASRFAIAGATATKKKEKRRKGQGSGDWTKGQMIKGLYQGVNVVYPGAIMVSKKNFSFFFSDGWPIKEKIWGGEWSGVARASPHTPSRVSP